MAAALVFDAAPHMEYRHENQTRLEAARDLGLWLVTQLPEQSEIAVLDTRLGSPAAFQPDRGAAKERIARLETRGQLAAAAGGARRAPQSCLRQSTLDRKEIYVFTDLSRGAWPEEQAARLQQQLGRACRTGHLRDRRGRRQSDRLRPGRRAAFGRSAFEPQHAERRDRAFVRRRRRRSASSNCTCSTPIASRKNATSKACDATPGELRPVEFRLGGLEPGTHQGFVRIVGQDGLAADDTRYFTVEVKPAWRVLLAAPKPAESYALFLAEALAPDLSRKRGQARFDCDVCDLGDLPSGSLPTMPPCACWTRRRWSRPPGRSWPISRPKGTAWRSSWAETPCRSNRSTARRRRSCCRASCCGRRRGPTATCIWPRAIFSTRSWRPSAARPARSPGTPFPCSAIGNSIRPAEAAWASCCPTATESRRVLERPVGRGRVLTMTTPVSDRPSQNPWNLLPVPAGEAWPFLILANQMAAYLVGSSDQQLNYLAGQTAVLPLDAGRPAQQLSAVRAGRTELSLSRPI